MITAVVPSLAALSAVPLLGETLGATALGGLACVTAGLLLACGRLRCRGRRAHGMKLPAFDTSTERLAVGLVAGGAARTRNEAGGALAFDRAAAGRARADGEAGLRRRPRRHRLRPRARRFHRAAHGLLGRPGPGGLGAGRPVAGAGQPARGGRGSPVPRAADGRPRSVPRWTPAWTRSTPATHRRAGGRWQVVSAPAFPQCRRLAAAPGRRRRWSPVRRLAAFGERLRLPAAARRVVAENDRAAAFAARRPRPLPAGEAVDAAALLLPARRCRPSPPRNALSCARGCAYERAACGVLVARPMLARRRRRDGGRGARLRLPPVARQLHRLAGRRLPRRGARGRARRHRRLHGRKCPASASCTCST